MSVQCKWCADSKTHDDLRCLREERDALEGYFREAVDALSVYLQSGGKYAHLMEPGQSITKDGPGRLARYFEQWVADLQSGLYINCVYCGHRYGPRETTPPHHMDCPADPENGARGECLCFKAPLTLRSEEARRLLA